MPATSITVRVPLKIRKRGGRKIVVAPDGAACHGCLLIAETSCEARNLFLDRTLLVPTMANADAAFFAIG